VTSVTQKGEPRRRMAAAERREAILGAALDAFAAGGYHETSLEDVAERAGISKALIYEHFTSKRDLHGALLETYVRELLSTVAEATAAAEPGEARLRAGLDGFLGFVERRRDAWRMLVRNTADAEIAASVERLRHEAAGAITALMVADAPPGSPVEGIERELAIEMLAEQLVGAAQSLANWWDENRSVSRERVLAIAMDFAWIGLERVGEGETWRDT
jgi:AcrR family transcriptional regulator